MLQPRNYPPMGRDEQAAVNNCLLATCLYAIKFCPRMRADVVLFLVRHHSQELMDAITQRTLAA